MKSTILYSLQPTNRSGAWKGGRAKVRILVALTAGVLVMPTPCEAKFTWKDLLGVLCTVGGVVSGSTGNVPVGVALIGVQTAIFSSNAVITNNPTILTGPEVTPAGLMGEGTVARSDAARQALLAIDCADVPVTGTPEQQIFIGKANIVIGIARQLRAAQGDPVAASNLVQQMAVALEDAANAYEALGLSNDEITQTQWDNFKLDCADGVAPALEEDYLIACGLTAEQRAALNMDQAAQRSVLDHRIKYKPGTVLHQAAARFNRNNVGFVDLMHQPIGDVALSQPAGGGGVHLQWGSTGTGPKGVSIALPSVASWDGYWSDLDTGDTLPVDAFIESSATGDVLDVHGATTNGPLGSWRMTKLGTSNYKVTADFSPVGATTVTVQVFNGSNLVFSAGGQSGILCTVNGCVSDDHWGRPTQKPVLGGALTLRGPTDITLQGSVYVGDRIAILPESTSTITAFSGVSITASGVPELTITNESTPALSSRPLIRWITIGVQGVFGGCFPGFGICSLSPFGTPDGTPVMLTHANGLTLEFLSAQTAAVPIFTISQDIPLDENAAHDFGFAKCKIVPGQYQVDFSQNPFGTVHLNIATEDIAIERGDGDQFSINWVNDGVNVLQDTQDLVSWTDMPVQVTKPVSNYHTPPKRFFRVRMRD
jgi:hypothetical protein